jgi:hypothetical protein
MNYIYSIVVIRRRRCFEDGNDGVQTVQLRHLLVFDLSGGSSYGAVDVLAEND